MYLNANRKGIEVWPCFLLETALNIQEKRFIKPEIISLRITDCTCILNGSLTEQADYRGRVQNAIQGQSAKCDTQAQSVIMSTK